MPRVHPPHPVPLTSLLLWGTFSSPFLPFRLTLTSLTPSPSHHVTLSFFVIFFVQIIASEFSVDVDGDTMMAKDPLPKCNKCGSSLLRPNILMFGDMSWLEERYHPLSLLITSAPFSSLPILSLTPLLSLSSSLRLLATIPPTHFWSRAQEQRARYFSSSFILCSTLSFFFSHLTLRRLSFIFPLLLLLLLLLLLPLSSSILS